MGILWAWVKARFFEDTTWAGLITIVQAAGLYIAPEIAETFVPFAMAVVGAIFVKRNDSPKLDTTGGTVTVKKPVA